MESKPWYKSKTMWFNIATVAAAGAGFIAGNPTAFLPFIPADWAPAVLAGVGLVNVVLRAITTTGVSR